jgi:nicotinamide mononucleotide (NMN) deamidase PncC
VFVGIAGPDGVAALTMELVGDRHQIQDRACREALSGLCGILRGEQPPLG